MLWSCNEKQRSGMHRGRLPGHFSSVNMEMEGLDVLSGNLTELPNRWYFASKCVLPTGVGISGWLPSLSVRLELVSCDLRSSGLIGPGFSNLFEFLPMWKKERLHSFALPGAFYLLSFWSPKHTFGVCLSSRCWPVFQKDLSGWWFTKPPLCPCAALWEDSGQHLQTCIFVRLGPNWGKHLCAGKLLRCEVSLSWTLNWIRHTPSCCPDWRWI